MKQTMVRALVAGCVLGLTLAGFACAADKTNEKWGILRGRFVYDGEAPAPRYIEPGKDREACGKILDERLMVDAKSRGIANVVIYLFLEKGQSAPAVHPSHEQTKKEPVSWAVKKCRLDPHVIAVQSSQELKISNRDEVGHNIMAQTFENRAKSPLILSGSEWTEKYKFAEAVPIKFTCSIHPWIVGYAIVQDHPYVAISDRDGKFMIENVPAGNRTFRAWHEDAGYIQKPRYGGKDRDWKRGNFTIEISDGETDLGEIELRPDLFRSN
jgi:hypothetical protein